jgi:hypothetical protein
MNKKDRCQPRFTFERGGSVRGFGSVSRDERDRITLKIDNAGDQFCLRMSIHTEPRSEIFMWYILSTTAVSKDEQDCVRKVYLVKNVTLGAENLQGQRVRKINEFISYDFFL